MRPELVQGRDGERELYQLVNELRRNLTAPAFNRIPIEVDLLTAGQTELVPRNGVGWVTAFVDIIPTVTDGTQSVAPIIRIGSDATFDNIAPLANLGTSLVVDEIVPVTLTSPMTTQYDPIYFDVQTAGSGPTTLTAKVYISGYYR